MLNQDSKDSYPLPFCVYAQRQACVSLGEIEVVQVLVSYGR